MSIESFIHNCRRAISDWCEEHINIRFDLCDIEPEFVNVACDCFYGMFWTDFYGDMLPFFCTYNKNNNQLSVKVYDSRERDSFTFDIGY